MSAASTREATAHVVAADGWSGRARVDPDEEAALWARCLHTGRPGLVEVAVARRDRRGALRMRSRSDRRRYPMAGDLGALSVLVRLHRSLGEEVFATPLTRQRPAPGHDGGIHPGAVCWVDLDHGQAREALRAFAIQPHIVVSSGSGGAHAYWRLSGEHPPGEIEAANRKLCAALDGDHACTEAARIMRVPGTVNHKAGRPCRLLHVDLGSPPIALAELTKGLEDPAPPAPPPHARNRPPAGSGPRDELHEIDPPAYFQALARVSVPESGGHITCPLPDHSDDISSCRVYSTAEEGWWCYGCNRGGRIYDLASLLAGGPWGRGLRGEEFARVRAATARAAGPPAAVTREDRPGSVRA